MLLAFGVRLDCQGQGIGTVAFKKLLQLIRESSIAGVRLLTLHPLEKAVPFYRSLGCVEIYEDEFKDARAEATRNAKAHIVKFFKENFSTEEQATNATKKAKSLHKEGNAEQVSVSKEQLKTTVEVVKSDANKVLSGVVVLKEQKIPSSNSGGTIRVTVGVRGDGRMAQRHHNEEADT